MRVFITGGTGTLGKSLLWQLLSTHHQVTIFSRDELKQSQLAHAIQVHFPDQVDSVRFQLGDVRDYQCVSKAISSSHPEVLIHAAALKQIPTCERFPLEAIATNVMGTANVARAAEGICRVILVSSDKAAAPFNTYGKTKALAESIVLSYENTCCVRYGNVFGSRGSLYEVWKHQKEQGDPISITNREMTRFFFSLKEAAAFVLRISNMRESGVIFIPHMKSIFIEQLARVLFPDSLIRITGIRAGEKLEEVLLADAELEHTQNRDLCFAICSSAHWSQDIRSLTRSGGTNLLDDPNEIRAWAQQMVQDGKETL